MHFVNLSVLLYVRDVNRSLDFYSDVLGAKVAWAWDENERHAVARLDPSKPVKFAALHFGKSEILLLADPEYKPPARVRSVVQLEVDNVDVFYRSAITRGLKPGPADTAHPPEPTDMPWGMRHVYVHDPDGHCLTFASPIGEGMV